MIMRLPITVDLDDIKVPDYVDRAGHCLTIHARIRGTLELAVDSDLKEDPWEENQRVVGSLDPTRIKSEMDGGIASLKKARKRGSDAVQDARKRRLAKKSKVPEMGSRVRK